MANFRNLGADFSNGVRAPHYTNGRLLTAEDLQSDQRALLERLAQTGQGVGYGIIRGFNISPVAGDTALRVTAGAGINRNGDVVQLVGGPINLPVQPIQPEDSSLRRSARFQACDSDTAGPTVLASGAYLLTAAPLARLEGAVPRQSCDGTETATCANQWEVEGVEFKIIRLTGYQAPTGNRSARNRNLLAHWFFGSDTLDALMRDPFHFDPAYTGFAEIGAEDLTACDLPLAAFFWANNRIAFVDAWSARRRLIHPYPGTAPPATSPQATSLQAPSWKANISDQRVAEGEARFLQFQEHLDDLRASFGAKTSSIRAAEHFGYLPPVGFLPVNPFELIVTDVFETVLAADRELQAQIQQRQLSLQAVLARVRTGMLGTFAADDLFLLARFFENLLPDHYQIVHEDVIHARLHQSWVQPPIPLPAPPQVVGGGLSAVFDFVLADGTKLAVELAKVDTVMAALLPGTKKVALADTIAQRFTRVSSNISGNVPSPSADIGTAPVAGDATAAQPAAIGLTATRLSRQTQPLIDLLVVDELIAPYRSILAKEMPDLIRAAIAALANNGGIFTGSNQFKAVTAEIHNQFLVNSFVLKALNRGNTRYTELLQLVNTARQPFFYVVFVRHRADSIRRPLQLTEIERD